MKKTPLLLLSTALFSFVLFTNGDPEAELRKPENAVKNLRIADGLQAQLFASEPMMTRYIKTFLSKDVMPQMLQNFLMTQCN